MANSPLKDGNKFGVMIYFSGQIGNQLFHYCLGKKLAAQYKLAFDPPPDFVDWEGHPVKWSGEPLFVMRPTPGEYYLQETCYQFGSNYWYDFDSLPLGKPLHACYGHWCRYELFRNWKNNIRNDWLKIPEHRFVETDPEATYIHVRRTDFLNDHDNIRTTTISQYGACLNALADGLVKRLIVITDAPRDPFLDGFKRFGLPVEVVSEAWDQDFLTLASCRKLIISNSTFSWWAGFLGKSARVVCPLFAGTLWDKGRTSRDELNLVVDDDPPGRWTFVTGE